MATQTLPTDGVSQETHKQIVKDRYAWRETPTDIEKFRRYAKGNHDLVLSDKQKDMLKNILGNQFCDNICHQIIAEARDRTKLIGFDCPDEKVKEQLDAVYIASQLARRQSEIHYDALRDGDHVLALGWSESKGRVKIFREPWFNGVDGVFVAYTGEDEPLYGVKDWGAVLSDGRGNETPITRRNLWFKDRLEKWATRDGGSSWEPFADPEDNGIWPQFWLKSNGDPLNIPYVHFKNAGRGSINYGMSELDGGILGFQDQINDIHYAMTAGGRQTAFQMYAFCGINTDEEILVGPGLTHKFSNPEAKVYTLPPGDMGQVIAVLDKKLGRVSVISRTPLHRISGGDWPSGEALLRSEQPAIGKAETQIASFQNAWASVGHKVTEIFNRFNKQGIQLSEDLLTAPVSATFEDPERRDPVSKSLVASNMREDTSPQWRLRYVFGMSQADIDKIMEERQELEESRARIAASAFDRGQGPGTSLLGKGAPSEGEDTSIENEEDEKEETK